MDQQLLRNAVNHVLELSDDDMSLLLTCVSTQRLKKGAALLKEGELCRSFYLVDHGHLRTYYNKDGVIINLNFTFEGEFTTNFKSYRNRQPSEQTIEAGEDTDVWVFSLGQYDQLRQNPNLARFIRRLAISSLLALEEYSDRFKILTPAERYLYVQQHNPRLLQRIPLSQIASYLGITRETLSRIRGKNSTGK